MADTLSAIPVATTALFRARSAPPTPSLAPSTSTSTSPLTLSSSSSSSSTLSLTSSESARKAQERLVKRTKLIGEIHDTERHYVNSITKIVSDYLNPLRYNSSDYNIKYETIATIFSNIEQIVGFHSILLVQLPPNLGPSEVCQVFLKFADFLKMYIPYVNNYSDAMKSLTALQENKKFQKFLAERKQTLGGLDLMSYLIMPVQRIPRYELLLKELKRCLDPPIDLSKPNEESQLLDEALSKIVAVAHQVNEQKRQAERVASLLAILSRVTNLDTAFPNSSLNAEHRRLIKDGELYKKNTFSKKYRHCYLFNDLFLWCNNNKYKGHVSINELKVNSIGGGIEEKEKNGSVGLNAAGENDKEYGIELIHPQIKTMILYVESQYDRVQWLNAFQEALDENETLDPHIIASLTPQQHERNYSLSSKLNTFNTTEINSPLTPLSPRSPANFENVEEDDDHVTVPFVKSEEQKEDNNSNKADEEKDKDDPVVIVENNPLRVNHNRQISRILDIKPSNHHHNLSSSLSKSISHPVSTVVSPTHARPRVSTSAQSHVRKVSVVVTSAGHSKKQSPIQTPTEINRKNSTESTQQERNRSTSNLKHNLEEKTEEKDAGTESNSVQQTKPAMVPLLTIHSVPTSPQLSPSSASHTNNTTPTNVTSASVSTSASISGLSRNDITSLKKMKNPPIPVKLAIESLAILLDLPPAESVKGEKKPNYWAAVQTILVKPNFLKLLLDFEAQHQPVTAEGITRLKEYVYDERLSPEAVQSCSPAAAVLWRWIRARYAAQTGETLPAEESVKQLKKAAVEPKVDSGFSSSRIPGGGNSRSTASRQISANNSRQTTPAHSREPSAILFNSSVASLSLTSRQAVKPHPAPMHIPKIPSISGNQNNGVSTQRTAGKFFCSPTPSSVSSPSHTVSAAAVKKKSAVFANCKEFALIHIFSFFSIIDLLNDRHCMALINHHWLAALFNYLSQQNQTARSKLQSLNSQHQQQLRSLGITNQEEERLNLILMSHEHNLESALSPITSTIIKNLKVLVKPPAAVIPVFQAILFLLESDPTGKREKRENRDLSLVAHKTVLNHTQLLAVLTNLTPIVLHQRIEKSQFKHFQQLTSQCSMSNVETSVAAAVPFCKWILAVKTCLEWENATGNIELILNNYREQQKLEGMQIQDDKKKYIQIKDTQVRQFLSASSIARVLAQ